jgi:hypothetical protein
VIYEEKTKTTENKTNKQYSEKLKRGCGMTINNIIIEWAGERP